MNKLRDTSSAKKKKKGLKTGIKRVFKKKGGKEKGGEDDDRSTSPIPKLLARKKKNSRTSSPTISNPLRDIIKKKPKAKLEDDPNLNSSPFYQSDDGFSLYDAIDKEHEIIDSDDNSDNDDVIYVYGDYESSGDDEVIDPEEIKRLNKPGLQRRDRGTRALEGKDSAETDEESLFVESDDDISTDEETKATTNNRRVALSIFPATKPPEKPSETLQQITEIANNATDADIAAAMRRIDTELGASAIHIDHLLDADNDWREASKSRFSSEKDMLMSTLAFVWDDLHNTDDEDGECGENTNRRCEDDKATLVKKELALEASRNRRASIQMKLNISKIRVQAMEEQAADLAYMKDKKMYLSDDEGASLEDYKGEEASDNETMTEDEKNDNEKDHVVRLKEPAQSKRAKSVEPQMDEHYKQAVARRRMSKPEEDADIIQKISDTQTLLEEAEKDEAITTSEVIELRSKLKEQENTIANLERDRDHNAMKLLELVKLVRLTSSNKVDDHLSEKALECARLGNQVGDLQKRLNASETKVNTLEQERDALRSMLGELGQRLNQHEVESRKRQESSESTLKKGGVVSDEQALDLTIVKLQKKIEQLSEEKEQLTGTVAKLNESVREMTEENEARQMKLDAIEASFLILNQRSEEGTPPPDVSRGPTPRKPEGRFGRMSLTAWVGRNQTTTVGDFCGDDVLSKLE